MALDPADFLAEGARRFDFLLGEAFVPHATGGHRLLYSSATFTVEVLYDDRDGRVSTLIDANVGERNPRANLICLYVAAGLGAAQDVREIARSAKLLGPVLESQAAALQVLLQELTGPRGADLLLKCHGT
jgi:hypothetical protein